MQAPSGISKTGMGYAQHKRGKTEAAPSFGHFVSQQQQKSQAAAAQNFKRKYNN